MTSNETNCFTNTKIVTVVKIKTCTKIDQDQDLNQIASVKSSNLVNDWKTIHIS